MSTYDGEWLPQYAVDALPQLGPKVASVRGRGAAPSREMPGLAPWIVRLDMHQNGFTAYVGFPVRPRNARWSAFLWTDLKDLKISSTAISWLDPEEKSWVFTTTSAEIKEIIDIICKAGITFNQSSMPAIYFWTLPAAYFWKRLLSYRSED